MIPHTWANTTLSQKRAGDSLNVECDIIGKYVEQLFGKSQPTPETVSMDMLVRSGFAAETTLDKW